MLHDDSFIVSRRLLMNPRTRPWLDVLVISIVATWFPAYASAHHTGTWKWTSTTESGQKFESIAKLKRSGRSFAGVYIGQKGQETPITSPKLDGRVMSFEVTRERDGQKVTVRYQGKIAGNTMKGKQEFRVGDQTRTLPWEAKREPRVRKTANVAGTPRDVAQKAIQKLGEQDNYSWTSERKGGSGDTGSVKGRIRKDGLTHAMLNMAGRSVEGVLKGRKGAIKTNEGWMSTEDFSGDGGSPGRNPMTFLARHLSTFAKPPVVQASGLLKQTKDLKSEGEGVHSGELTEEGVKQNLPQFGVEVSDPEGSVKFWVKDGMLAKYTYTVRGNVTFLQQQRQVDYDRTTTVEIRDAGATKLEVPEEALKKIE
jgi:hypothetical protein